MSSLQFVIAPNRPVASMGSMFKNPLGDYSGRLIEAAGLKGAQVGGAQISPLHANFFINQGHACANDIYQLIEMAIVAVEKQFGIRLELEIQLVGDWPVDSAPVGSGRIDKGMENKLRVGVIFGGRSGEHEVSLMSARCAQRP